MIKWATCKKCNAHRPIEHIYCFVCGEELSFPSTYTCEEKVIPGICRFCGKEFVITAYNKRTCNDPVCIKLSNRLCADNHTRRKKGLSNLETFDKRYCKVCGKPIPLDKLSNSVIVYCSDSCRRMGHAIVQIKYETRKVLINA